MSLKWGSSGQSGNLFVQALWREARRLLETADENNMSVAEINAYSKMLWEIGWAVAHAQPWPEGHNSTPSAHCISTVMNAANLAEMERYERHQIGGSLLPLIAEGEVYGK